MANLRRTTRINTNPKLRAVKRQAKGFRRKPVHERRVHYDRGFAYGYAEGLRNGQEQYGARLEGTSIIIPNFNKLDLLKQCISSIQAYTPTPHEIIVVDNASTDGAASYLDSMAGKLRYYVHESNKGFAGAVNTGLMMAKGQTICVLNNDIVVTPNWLSNLLLCLNSDPNIGIVGPVTNYISGEQQIEVPYTRVDDMQSFAAKYNVSNPEKWQYTDRIVGFCFLFSRTFFDTNGYFDEGFEIGNFEDEDYVVRALINGRKLVVARDTFIHHYGSQSMRALGDQFQVVNDKNAAFFSAKWADPHNWVRKMQPRIYDGQGSVVQHFRSQSFYPSHVAVTGLSETVYWVEQGAKHPLRGHVGIPVVKVSQVDLLGWPTGNVMDASVAEAKWHERLAADGTIPDGGMFTTETGRWYQRQGDTYREVVSGHALNRWQLEGRLSYRTESERLQLHEGIPIIAAPVIHAYHI
ncbi:glycosyltransferase family 2 protein [Paenibacillus taiwanensis]|uniref:glycosyltransferase family 2 protein n=1 Tax=Paenibacillus taiwanensis TaxID=401638 RepID=UPI00041873FE|nr:glycosyltransferase family 2 protein [Paenibacillus taiwanensis]